jgi:hypothetical protein
MHRNERRISLAGVCIPILLWVLGELKVHLPMGLLVVLFALAVLLIAGPWITAGHQRMRHRKTPGRTDFVSGHDSDGRAADQSVISHDQSGGITAHTVTIGLRDRGDDSG